MDKKEFKKKIESNRNKAFGVDKPKYEKEKYSPKTNKPKPTTYEADYQTVREALESAYNTSVELKDFIDYIFDLDNHKLEHYWFDDMLHKVGEFMLKRNPQLQQKRNIHTKYSISVNGFSIKLENNIGFDFNVKYEVSDGIAVIDTVHTAITVYGKVNPSTIIMLNESDVWKKKEFKKPFKKSYNKEGNYNRNRKQHNIDRKISYYAREY